MRYLVVLLLIFSSAVFAEKVYQWTDAQGNTVFSDKPHPSAKQIDVPDLPSFDAKTGTSTSQIKSSAAVKKQASAQKVIYTALNILTPKNEETIWSNQGIILVSVQLKPELASGDKLWVMVDGKQAAQITNGTSVELSNIDRGTHSVQAQITDKADKVVKASSAVTVYLHKTTVNQGQKAASPSVVINRP